MLSLTNKQIATIARLQQLAAMTYNKHEYPARLPASRPCRSRN